MKIKSYLLACILLAIALTVFAMPVSAGLKDVPQGGPVLLGELCLNITDCVDGANYIGYWASGSNVTYVLGPLIPGSNLTCFDITDPYFSLTADGGFWYQTSDLNGSVKGPAAFRVVTPRAEIEIVNLDLSGKDITDGLAVLGSDLDFIIRNSTLQYIQNRSPSTPMDCDIQVFNPLSLKYTGLYTPTNYLHSLTDQPVLTVPYYWSSGDDSGSSQPDSWDTGKHDNNIPCNYFYPFGTYIVKIACNQNSLGFTSTPSHTVTLYPDTLTLNIIPPSVTRGERFSTTISGVPKTTYLLWVKNCAPLTGEECDQPPFILPEDQQDPDLDIWYDEYRECDFGETPIQCTDCFGCLKRVEDTVPDIDAPDNGAWYVLIETDENGQATVEWQTTVDTGIRSVGCDVDCWDFPIRVQRFELGNCCPEGRDCPYAPWKCKYDPNVIFDEKTVTVCKGEFDMWTVVYNEVTDQAYLGETVCIRGINLDSCCVYLFIKGPCQSCPGNNLCCNKPVTNGDGSTFTSVQVNENGYWEYIWQTKLSPLDLGQYTIYAASKPNDAPSLECKPCNDCQDVDKSCAAWDKQNFTFLKPTLTADIHPKVLRIVCCQEPPIVISGKATGIVSDSLEYGHRICPGPGCPYDEQLDGGSQDTQVEFKPVPVAIWVFGPDKVAGNKYIFETTLTDCPSGNFSIDLSKYINTLQLQPGEYKVVVQHPMYNHVLDVIPDSWLLKWYFTYPWWVQIWNPTYVQDPNRFFVISRVPVQWSKLFQIDGPGRVVGIDAYNELIEGLNDPNVDDIYVVLDFKVESNNAVIADFTGIPTVGTAPLNVSFMDLSSGGPTQWNWSFGDGQHSTLVNPYHTYTGPGSYDVSLTASNGVSSSTSTKNGYVVVTQVGPTVTPTVPPVNPNQINLMTGWNFVSTPMTLADGQNTAGVVFASVNTGGRSIYLYDASTGLWDAMSASDPVIPLDGIWIYSTTPKQVTLVFKSGGASTPPTKAVYGGWNAIGFSGVLPRSAASDLVSVNDPPRKNWANVIGWDASSQVYNPPIANIAPDNTALLFPTNGYWLFMNGDNPPWVLS
jgi:PKD repeat protein